MVIDQGSSTTDENRSHCGREKMARIALEGNYLRRKKVGDNNKVKRLRQT